MLFHKCTQKQAEILYEILLLVTAVLVCITQIGCWRQHLQRVYCMQVCDIKSRTITGPE